jgi:hypothetical protein
MSDISHKPEKIASAIYLITGFFADQEPLKWKLRVLSADLVSVGMSLMSQMFKEREAARLEIRSIIWEVNGLLSVARNTGLVSEPNYQLLSQELLKYLENIGFPAGIREEGGLPVLSESFFGSAERELKAPEQKLESDVKDNSHNEHISYLPEVSAPCHEPRMQKDTRPEPKPKADKPFKEFGAVSVKKNSRQSIIIALLKRKKEIMIKDVSPLISGCSEKTIQRELLAMVNAGILKKTGEKRWSRYSLARP